MDRTRVDTEGYLCPPIHFYSHNTKIVDPKAPRLAFVRNAIALKLNGEFPKNGEIASHSDTEMKPRRYNIDQGVWIEEEDSGKPLRLKDLCDIDERKC